MTLRTILLTTLLLAGGCSLFLPEPPTYTVVRGDTLGRIARQQGCTVAELRAWNGIEGDLIEIGQVLVVGEARDGAAEPSSTVKRTPGAGRLRRQAPAREGAREPAVKDGLALRMPAPKACLAEPTDVETTGMEAAFMASRGLDGGQVREALRAFEPNLVRCLTAGDGTAGRLGLELTVGCDGRVAAVALVDDDGLPSGLVSCVRDTLRFVPFPAHDMPDGFTFGYPVTIGP